MRKANRMSGELTHFDSSGASRMVNVGDKEITERFARAQAFVSMQPSTLKLIQDRQLAKGDVLEVARLAGIMATKQTQNLIPLCHSLGLDSASIDYEFVDGRRVRIEARVSNHGRTGVEMEAMTAVSIAALTIYDMCKAVDRWMSIGPLELLEKSGGKSGHLERTAE
jgi:cyclic pyranopterin phosphate synthase